MYCPHCWTWVRIYRTRLSVEMGNIVRINGKNRMFSSRNKADYLGIQRTREYLQKWTTCEFLSTGKKEIGKLSNQLNWHFKLVKIKYVNIKYCTYYMKHRAPHKKLSFRNGNSSRNLFSDFGKRRLTKITQTCYFRQERFEFSRRKIIQWKNNKKKRASLSEDARNDRTTSSKTLNARWLRVSKALWPDKDEKALSQVAAYERTHCAPLFLENSLTWTFSNFSPRIINKGKRQGQPSQEFVRVKCLTSISNLYCKHPLSTYIYIKTPIAYFPPLRYEFSWKLIQVNLSYIFILKINIRHIFIKIYAPKSLHLIYWYTL